MHVFLSFKFYFSLFFLLFFVCASLIQAPMSSEEFSTVSLKLDSFKPYYRGREIPDGEPLDVGNITMFGLQVYGGVYLPFKQCGVSALEIETIAAS